MKQALRTMSIILLVIAVVAISVSAGNLEKGFKAGMNISNLGGRDVRVSEQRIGLVAGGYATYLFYEFLAVQVEALYVMKGAVAETSIIDSGSVGLSYVEIPLLMKVLYPAQKKQSDEPSYFSKNLGIRPSLYFGPTVSVSLQSEMKVGATSAAIKSTDIGIAFGICLDFETGKGLFSFDARYTAGQTDIPDVGSDVFIHNSVTTLTVGYTFR